MKAINFRESNKILGPPPGKTEAEVFSLPIYNDGQQCISCWELSEEELSKIQETKHIWLSILSGLSQPPVWLAIDNPFIAVETPKLEEIKVSNIDDFVSEMRAICGNTYRETCKFLATNGLKELFIRFIKQLMLERYNHAVGLRASGKVEEANKAFGENVIFLTLLDTLENSDIVG